VKHDIVHLQTAGEIMIGAGHELEFSFEVLRVRVFVTARYGLYTIWALASADSILRIYSTWSRNSGLKGRRVIETEDEIRDVIV